MIRNLFRNFSFGIIILLIMTFISYIYEVFFGIYSFTESKKLESTNSDSLVNRIRELYNKEIQEYIG